MLNELPTSSSQIAATKETQQITSLVKQPKHHHHYYHHHHHHYHHNMDPNKATITSLQNGSAGKIRLPNANGAVAIPLATQDDTADETNNDLTGVGDPFLLDNIDRDRPLSPAVSIVSNDYNNSFGNGAVLRSNTVSVFSELYKQGMSVFLCFCVFVFGSINHSLSKFTISDLSIDNFTLAFVYCVFK